MIDTNNLASLIGAHVLDSDGDKIGTVGQVYVDPDTSAPTWVTIKTGLFGGSQSFAPIQSATWNNSELTVPYEKAFVKDAPRIDDDGALSDEEENTLYAYYGMGTGAPVANTGARDTGTGTGTVGHDTSGPNTDTAMTRSEEELHVGTRTVETGRARLRKFVVTEQQTVTVPVSHEEVRIVREPITDANVGSALDGPAISEEEHEVVLTADKVVVDKDVVPVERVALDTETVTEQQKVTEAVRKEQIELIDPTTSTDARDRK